MKATCIALVLFVSVTLAAGAAEPSQTPVVLKVGDKAPDFAIALAGGSSAKLSDFQGKKNVLVAFFPKAFTPGCTAQMCGYRDDFSMFQSADTEIVAVSVDAQSESDRFKKEKQFPFPVVGDPDSKIVKAYGVPFMDLPAGHLARRSVFLVDQQGVIRYVDMSYDVTKSKDALYDAIKKLKTPENKG
jgi:peroxiredoxin